MVGCYSHRQSLCFIRIRHLGPIWDFLCHLSIPMLNAQGRYFTDIVSPGKFLFLIQNHRHLITRCNRQGGSRRTLGIGMGIYWGGGWKRLGMGLEFQFQLLFLFIIILPSTSSFTFPISSSPLPSVCCGFDVIYLAFGANLHFLLAVAANARRSC